MARKHLAAAARLEPLRSPLFLASVAVLVLNDLVLKPEFSNWVTGKLSDFAGVWALGYFLMTVTRWPRAAVAPILAIAFAFWKSPASESFIEAWNGAIAMPIGRTVDWTDLLALLTLLLLPRIAPFVEARRPRALVNVSVAVVAMVAFVATQRAGEHVCCHGTYEFPGTEAALVSRLERTGATHVRREPARSDQVRTSYSFTLPEQFCGRSVHALVEVRESAGKTTMSVGYLLYDCSRTDDAAVQELFERTVVSRLKERR